MNFDNRKTAKDFLGSLVEQKQITSDGRDWLITALDPFHDMNHQLAGYPDTSVSQTVVSCYNYQTTVTAPAGAAADWDCHVYTLPLSQATTAMLLNQNADWTYASNGAVAQTFQAGPLNIVAAPPGNPLIPTTGGLPNQTITTLPNLQVEDLSSGTSRVIAMGFEVHNTTAEIYKQGAVCTYRLPCNGGPNQIVFGRTNATPPDSASTLTGIRFPQPPSSQASAMLMKGTRTWEAKDGVYATCFQSSVTNPLIQMSNYASFFTRDADPGFASELWVSGCDYNANYSPVAYGRTTPYPNKAIPFDVTGAIFTGLSHETSLTVNLRVYVERAPGFSLAQLAPLASPSAGYDVKALELYAQAINCLPPAVKVGENAAGDWWRAVTSVLKHVAGEVGPLLKGVVPGAGLVGSAVQYLAGQLDSRRSISKQVEERLPDVKRKSEQTKKVNNTARKGVRVVNQKASLLNRKQRK